MDVAVVCCATTENALFHNFFFFFFFLAMIENKKPLQWLRMILKNYRLNFDSSSFSSPHGRKNS